MKNNLAFSGSNQYGYKAIIRQSDDGYSLFRWIDDGSGVYRWQENHGLAWAAAFKLLSDWLNIVPAERWRNEST